jgi:hypothetical protein
MANYIPGTPSDISATGLDAAALRKIAWGGKYKQDSVRPSIWTELKSEHKFVNDQLIPVKNGIIMNVSNVGTKAGAQSIRLALRTPLAEAPREGTGENMLGNEDESGLKYFTAYYNEIKKAIKYNTWGYNYNDTEYLAYNEGYSGLMGTYWQELDDLRYQTALLLGFSNELTKAPVSLTQTFTKNWAIPNLDHASYPTWDVDTITYTAGTADSNGYYSDATYSGASSFTENVGDALVSAAGTGATPTATLTVDSIKEITYWIEDQIVVEPIDIDGVPSYLWKMPPAVIQWVTNPGNTGSLGAWWQNVKQYKDEKRMTLPGEVGRLCETFLVIKDRRCPTLTLGTSGGARTLQPGFIYPGNHDGRNNSAWSNSSGATNYVFDMTTIIGKDALCQYTRDDLNMDLYETTEYEKIRGRGSYKGCGIVAPIYDNGTTSATSGISRGHCQVPVSRVANF